MDGPISQQAMIMVMHRWKDYFRNIQHHKRHVFILPTSTNERKNHVAMENLSDAIESRFLIYFLKIKIKDKDNKQAAKRISLYLGASR